MSRKDHCLYLNLFVTVALVAVIFAGCGTEGDPTSASNTQQEATGGGSGGSSPAGTPSKPPVMPSDRFATSNQPISYDVPDGAPEEILSFIQQLEQVQPEGQTQEEALAHFTKIQHARIQGAEKILASQSTNEIRITAVHTKIDALRMLDQSGAENAKTELTQFATSLQASQDAEVARLGRILSFGFYVDEFVVDGKGDFTTLKCELDSLLNDKDGRPHIVPLGQQVASVLYDSGKKENARDVMLMMSEKIKDDENFADAAKNLSDQARMIELDFQAKMEAALEGKPDAVQPLIGAIKQLVGTGQPSGMIFEVTRKAGNNLEMSGNYEASTNMYHLMLDLFKDNSKKELAEAAQQTAQNGLRRIALIGKPFEVTGVTLDGKPIDWNQYKGKVVLVDFWATWCGWCLREFPSIRKYYDAYRDKGFEVVSVNVDDDRQSVDSYFANQTLPWATVVSGDPEAQGLKNPLAVQCGIDSLPFVVLVNGEGNVAAIHVRGEELGKHLTSMLGPTELTTSEAAAQ